PRLASPLPGRRGSRQLARGGWDGGRGRRCSAAPGGAPPAGCCERGFTGARCERLDLFYLRGDQDQIVVISLIAVLVMLIALVTCLCVCTRYCQKKYLQKKEKEMRTFDKGLPVKTEDVLETAIA
ncbi:probetacellulin, partial [Eublepharis macularius]|uniref:Probetacellulin n=1 Tax=Eublepharis macularius TaxID=481883 RepID=A0AA97LAH0_EUBMA